MRLSATPVSGRPMSTEPRKRSVHPAGSRVGTRNKPRASPVMAATSAHTAAMTRPQRGPEGFPPREAQLNDGKFDVAVAAGKATGSRYEADDG
jgi:hypothetical protein